MRIAAILIGAILATSAAQAQAETVGLPSQEMLSQMGLSGIKVMTDAEAAEVRGSGYSWGGHSHISKGIYRLHKSVRKFHVWVKKFHKKVKHFHRRVGKRSWSHRPHKKW